VDSETYISPDVHFVGFMPRLHLETPGHPLSTVDLRWRHRSVVNHGRRNAGEAVMRPKRMGVSMVRGNALRAKPGVNESFNHTPIC
jgi:hypothetical protein